MLQTPGLQASIQEMQPPESQAWPCETGAGVGGGATGAGVDGISVHCLFLPLPVHSYPPQHSAFLQSTFNPTHDDGTGAGVSSGDSGGAGWVGSLVFFIRRRTDDASVKPRTASSKKRRTIVVEDNTFIVFGICLLNKEKVSIIYE